jgi:hypothetical protein
MADLLDAGGQAASEPPLTLLFLEKVKARFRPGSVFEIWSPGSSPSGIGPE